MKKFILNASIMAMTLTMSTAVYGQDVSNTKNPENSVNRPVKQQQVSPELMEQKRAKLEELERQKNEKLNNLNNTETKRAQVQELNKKLETSSQQKKEDLIERKSQMGTSSENRIANAREQLNRLFVKMLDRIQATIQRQEKIIERIESRMDKIKEDGGNTTEAERYVSDAKSNIQKARNSLTSLRNTTALGMQNISTTTGAIKLETMTKMRSEVGMIQDYLKTSHRSLVNAISSLKGLSTTTKTN